MWPVAAEGTEGPQARLAIQTHRPKDAYKMKIEENGLHSMYNTVQRFPVRDIKGSLCGERKSGAIMLGFLFSFDPIFRYPARMLWTRLDVFAFNASEMICSEVQCLWLCLKASFKDSVIETPGASTLFRHWWRRLIVIIIFKKGFRCVQPHADSHVNVFTIFMVNKLE